MGSPACFRRATGCMLVLMLMFPRVNYAQAEFEAEPICYDSADVHDPIARLQQRIDAQELTLAFDDEHGYLPAVLEALKIPRSSQTLVFSKTSFQLRRISSYRPRALYFNDEVYVGWVQGGDIVEIASVDPQQGSVFYTLEQQPDQAPRFVRDRGQCISCHASARTQGVPGLLVRSVFADADGQPHFGSGTFTTSHRSPFKERFGGWYVTGTHGDMRHMGNVISNDRDEPEKIDAEAGANVTDLSDLVNLKPYLVPHSDIVALMVLEHQSQMHNFVTLANYESRRALHYDGIMNSALERPADFQSDSTKRRIADAGEKLLKYLLFCDEFQLSAPVRGTSGFVEAFEAKGPRDSQGRSLREFDLETRLLKYPCSYLIYGDAFQQLPAPMRSHVLTRLHEVLTGVDDDPAFAHLSAEDRRAILEILSETLPDLPAAWSVKTAGK